MRDDPLLALAVVFVPFSLVSIGGAMGIIPGIQHEVVDVRHWLSPREFVDIFAVVRGAPGPGSMLVTVIGWKVAGWMGAIVATLALYVPSSLVCYGVARIWNRNRGKRWHRALERGLAPIGAGLMLAAVISLVRILDPAAISWIVIAAATLAFALLPRLNPIVPLAAAGLAVVAFHQIA